MHSVLPSTFFKAKNFPWSWHDSDLCQKYLRHLIQKYWCMILIADSFWARIQHPQNLFTLHTKQCNNWKTGKRFIITLFAATRLHSKKCYFFYIRLPIESHKQIALLFQDFQHRALQPDEISVTGAVTIVSFYSIQYEVRITSELSQAPSSQQEWVAWDSSGQWIMTGNDKRQD